MNKTKLGMVAAVVLLMLGWGAGAQMQPSGMTFFITSAGSGKGADLGGLAGADKLCQSLAAAAGAGKRTWRAYLSTTATGGSPVVNARDRIGKGPWHNAEGRLIARNVAELHGNNNINRTFALTEKGTKVNGRADSPNTHDILTGSLPDGRVATGSSDTTCGNWTKSGEGFRDGRPPRPLGPARRRPLRVLELLAPVARLQPGQPARLGRRGAAVLLRDELKDEDEG